ncbi:hypothetical protein CBR_g31869 [Chara braunii]|uniref:Uncharacterized protein n=1 Tax=Chara braunii TaxID=69332 RepID=A0A388LFV3_CHABU|nr:hypothetical protein CBR_g31869 [Chara braunii]|eukprot:GBG81196.1 hypothetical protein CBR_g31869 [Chara braunii]
MELSAGCRGFFALLQVAGSRWGEMGAMGHRGAGTLGWGGVGGEIQVYSRRNALLRSSSARSSVFPGATSILSISSTIAFCLPDVTTLFVYLCKWWMHQQHRTLDGC